MSDGPEWLKKGPTKTALWPGNAFGQRVEYLRDVVMPKAANVWGDFGNLDEGKRLARANVYEFADTCFYLAKHVFDSERVAMDQARVERIMEDYNDGRRDRLEHRLYLAACVAYSVRNVCGQLELGDSFEVAAASIALANDWNQLVAYLEFEPRSPAKVGLPARKRVQYQRIEALRQGLSRGEVQESPAAIARWRGEPVNRATRERARKDLEDLRANRKANSKYK